MYSIRYEVPAPIEAYDALHTAVKDVTASDGEGLLVHIARRPPPASRSSRFGNPRSVSARSSPTPSPRPSPNLGGMGDMSAPPIQEFELRGFLVYAKDPIVV
jgi:hypothetical protein